MPASPPDPGNTNGSGTNLVTSADGLYRYAVWYTSLGNDVTVGKQTRSTGVWTTHTMAGSERTQLNMPMLRAVTFDHVQSSTGVWGDGHRAGHGDAVIGYDSSGYLHVFANFDVNPNTGNANLNLSYLRSNSPNDITAWTVGTLPGAFASMSYPHFVQCPNGDLYLQVHGGPLTISLGNSDVYDWRIKNGQTAWTNGDGSGASSVRKIFQGLSVPNAKGAGIPGDDSTTETSYNWWPYHTNPFVDQWGRCHESVGYRKVFATSNLEAVSYIYSDDSMQTFHAADASSVTLPIDPVNSSNVYVLASSDTYTNVDFDWSMAVDPATRYPRVHVSQLTASPQAVAWNGSSWTTTSLPTAFAGQATPSLAHPVYVHGTLYYMITSGTTNNVPRSMWMCDAAGTVAFSVAHDCEPTGKWTMTDGLLTSHAMKAYDPVAYLKFGSCEWLVPDGDTPKVYTFGDAVRIHA